MLSGLAAALTVLAVVTAAPAEARPGRVPAADREIVFTADGTTAFGTLHVPEHRAGQRMRAALLLPGSGPTDRDGNQPPEARRTPWRRWPGRWAATASPRCGSTSTAPAAPGWAPTGNTLRNSTTRRSSARHEPPTRYCVISRRPTPTRYSSWDTARGR